ncbi:MAG: manganese efflux pump [Lachnospiraceae bacterium]|nr:manganese efflux pump [Lachnospiraceae bacterium]
MSLNLQFILNSLILGIGLAMDAFSVSIANGLNEPVMPKKKMCGIAFVFAFFQWLMPMAGWTCVHTIVTHFRAFERWIPWIALILLLFIGIKMIAEGARSGGVDAEPSGVGIYALLIQGIATSIDALSTGFAIAEYGAENALVCALTIGIVTFVICFAGLAAGKRFGVKLAGRAPILGGIILIGIGIEIWIKSVL